MSVTYTATLSVRAQTVLNLSRLLHAERRRRGTRSGARTLSCFKQAVLVIRWLLDATRVRQLAAATDRQNHRLRAPSWGIDVLAAQAPNLHGALLAAKAAGYSHVNIDGTLIETGRVAALGPTEGSGPVVSPQVRGTVTAAGYRAGYRQATDPALIRSTRGSCRPGGSASSVPAGHEPVRLRSCQDRAVRVVVSCGWQPDLDLEAAVRPGAGFGPAAVRPGH